jgi:hypothetical protein
MHIIYYKPHRVLSLPPLTPAVYKPAPVINPLTQKILIYYTMKKKLISGRLAYHFFPGGKITGGDQHDYPRCNT